MLEGTISELDTLVHSNKLVSEDTRELNIQFVHFQLDNDAQQWEIKSTKVNQLRKL